MPLQSPRWSRALAIIVVAAALLGSSTRALIAANAPVNEYDLKAALVYRTAKFIEWPAGAFAADGSPFVVCVVGNNPAAISSFRALEAKTIDARTIAVRRIGGDMLDLRQCHAAYFPADAADGVSYAADKLQNAPVLTVGDSRVFIDRGGMLALVVGSEGVSFLIQHRAAKRAQLGVSSQLLQLATVIE